MSIYPGSTPTHFFDLPVDVSKMKDIEITYAQNDKVVLVKHLKDGTVQGKEFILDLTQEDTFLFDKNISTVQIQVRLLDGNDKVHPSELMFVPLKKCLSKEVLGDAAES